VKGFDEIVVCDMYSVDGTLSIVSQYDAKVVMHDRCGIVEPARAFAISQASKEWVLLVDSDEVAPPALEDYLYNIPSQADIPDGLWIPRKNYFMNKLMRSSFPDYQMRFFRKERFVDWPATIHSHPLIEGSIRKAPPRKELALVHLERNRIAAMVSKTNHYTDKEIERDKNAGATVAGLLLKPCYRFLKLYVFKGGFLDGRAGLIYAMLGAYNKFLTLSKSIEKRLLS
jgi:glycosyltransferase involved in cell wall biosynthesis